MKVVTAAQMKAIDRWAIVKMGIPAVCLMENAGRAVAEIILKEKKDLNKVTVVCGAGNNGGDGFVTARYLKEAGTSVNVILAGKRRSFTPESKANYERACAIRVPILEWGKPRSRAALIKADIVVDALFGVGLSRPVDGPYARLVDAINQSGRPVISVDVPSGLHATTGRVLGVAVRASRTIALGFAKKGFYRGQGPALCGRVTVVDIGIPPGKNHAG